MAAIGQQMSRKDMKRFDLWKWPQRWIMPNNSIAIDIDPENPVMADLICKYCGKVFKYIKSREKHENKSREQKSNSENPDEEGNFVGCPKDGINHLHREYWYVPPISEVRQKEIAEYHFLSPLTGPKRAMQIYSDRLTSQAKHIGLDELFAAELKDATARSSVSPDIFNDNEIGRAHV
mgnify:FL=1